MKACDKRDDDPLAALAKWYQSPVGRHVAAAENACLERLLADSFGYYLIQLGAFGQFQEAAQACRIRHRLVLDETLNECADGVQLTDASSTTKALTVTGIRSQPYRLPLASASVDAVILPHTLDFCTQAHEVLREVERILIPEGRVILFCFNPLSTWGLMRWLPRRCRRVPWCGSQSTPFHVGDRLRLLGLQQETREMLVFRPPLRRAYISQLDWMESVGGRYWSMFGGVFAVRAVKRLKPLTPLRPRWMQRARLLPGSAMEPTARGNGNA